MYTIFHNVDGEKTTTLSSDSELITFTKSIAKENEDQSIPLGTVDECLNYIREFCPNLTLDDLSPSDSREDPEEKYYRDCATQAERHCDQDGD